MKRLFSILSISVLALMSTMASSAYASAGEMGDLAKMGVALGAGLCIGLAAAFGGLAQGRATSTALEGIARNPGAASAIQTPMIIGLALIESLVIYALLIAFLLQGKI